MCLRFLLPFFLLISLIQAESVKSITGNIIFDINNDGTSEAKLTSDGLAIGDSLSPSANLHLQGNGIVTGDLVIGGTAGNSTLEIQGTVGYNTQTISSNTTLSGNSVILVDTSSDNVTVTLPYAGNVMGRLYTIKKTSASNEVLLKGGGNNIDSGSSYTFTSGNNSSIKVVSNGKQWYVMSKSDIGFSVNGSWTPADITTTLWLDASDSSTVLAGGSDNVYQWNDKSGNNYHLTQATGDKQPIQGTINGLNAMDADGTDDVIKYGSLPVDSSGNVMVFATAKIDSGLDSFDSIFTMQGSNDWQFDSSASTNFTPRIRQSGIGSDYTPAIQKTGPSVYCAVFDFDNTVMRIYVDGIELGSGGTYTTKISTPTEFKIFENISVNKWINANVGECVVITSIDDPTRQKIEGYLAHKWGLEGNLDAGHPYKSSPP